jgi:hypothetical protein
MPPSTSHESAAPLDYPDVLGTITGGPRLTIDVVQCAFAVYPRGTAVGQPFEALVLLQNICDKPIQVQVSLMLPRKDTSGNRLTLITPKDEIVINMQPGETGMLHMPVVPHLPTQPSQNNKMLVRVRVKAPGRYKYVRQPLGGRAASALNMSPFRLNILREVSFIATAADPDVLSAPFDIIPGLMENIPVSAPRYESIWTTKELPNEEATYKNNFALAEKFAAAISRSVVMEPLIEITEKRFVQIGMPLHPAEALFMSKALTYTMEDGIDLEPGFKLETSRWFQRLVSIMQDQYILQDSQQLVSFLYTAVLHDAVRLCLPIIERAGKQKFGTSEEHAEYADEVVMALEGRQPVDLGHIYLPLVLNGILLNQGVKLPKESLWTNIEQMREAWRGRVRLAGSAFDPVAKMLDNFLYEAEQTLIRSRVPRPS